MKAGGDIAGWPQSHFLRHKKRFAGFDPATLRALLVLRVTAQIVENDFLNATTIRLDGSQRF